MMFCQPKHMTIHLIAGSILTKTGNKNSGKPKPFFLLTGEFTGPDKHFILRELCIKPISKRNMKLLPVIQQQLRFMMRTAKKYQNYR